MADLQVRRFCPRCNSVTVWDSPGDGVLQCTNWPVDAVAHCGFTLGATLTDAEWASAQRYEKRLNPRQARTSYTFV